MSDSLYCIQFIEILYLILVKTSVTNWAKIPTTLNEKGKAEHTQNNTSEMRMNYW